MPDMTEEEFEALKVRWAFNGTHWPFPEILADVKALIAEVERLRAEYPSYRQGLLPLEVR